jgi:CPA1 family monovalent cation:H+ antiporter
VISEGIRVSLAAIGVRILWVVLGAAIWRRLRRDATVDTLSSGEAVVVAWAGMRGVVSLAAALALPAALHSRDLILFLTFCVILSTLVGQGLSLPALMRRLGLAKSDAEEREEARARTVVARAAPARLDTLAAGERYPAEVLDDLQRHYAAQVHLAAAPGAGGAAAQIHQQLRRDLLAVERRTLIEMRDRDEINDDTLRRIQRDLNLEEVRLNPGRFVEPTSGSP